MEYKRLRQEHTANENCEGNEKVFVFVFANFIAKDGRTENSIGRSHPVPNPEGNVEKDERPLDADELDQCFTDVPQLASTKVSEKDKDRPPKSEKHPESIPPR